MKTEDQKFRNVVKELAESSSLHGVSKIASSRQIVIKGLWTLLFLAVFGLFCLQLASLFQEYYSYPIKTKVSLEFSPLDFPAITFCNMNPIKKTIFESSEDLKTAFNTKKKNTPASGAAKRKRRDVGMSSTAASGSVSPSAMSSTMVQSSVPASASSVIGSASATTSAGPVSSAAMSSAAPSASGISPSISASPASSSVAMGSVASSAVSGESSSYYYDYWNPWFDNSYGNNDSYSYDYDDSYGQDSSGYWGSSYYGMAEMDFFQEQLTSPKDQWDERILSLQTSFRNFTALERGDMGHTVENMVQSVSFARTLQNASHFEKVTTSTYGNCYTMSSPKYIAWRSGPTHGVKLTINLEIDEYMINFATGYGMRMVFHEPGTYPLPEEQGFTLSPGYETSIGLRMVKVSRLGHPHGNCTDGKGFREKYKIMYSVAACMQFCRIQRTAEVCGCIPRDTPDIELHIQTERICNDSHTEDKKCALRVDISFDQGTSQCDCISPCHEKVYDKTMSGTRWPKDDYLKNVLMKSVCAQNDSQEIPDIKSACDAIKTNYAYFNTTYSPKYRYNFLRVLIYYEDLNFESIDQEKMYESTRFLSDIGGAMGLFMGASVLSFVEVLQLLMEVILFLWRRGCRRSLVQTMDPEKSRKQSMFPDPIRMIDNREQIQMHKLPADPNYVSPF